MHLGIDAETLEIRAVEVTDNGIGDAPMLPLLLAQIPAAEVIGYGTNSDGDHPTHPNTVTMEVAMRLALDDAGLPPTAIGYVNAHGTATEQGDIAESQATERVFGQRMPITTSATSSGLVARWRAGSASR